MNNSLAQFLVLLGGIVTVAVIAVIVSKKSNTSNVISAFFGGFSQSIEAAVSPVTGQVAVPLQGANINNLGIGG